MNENLVQTGSDNVFILLSCGVKRLCTKNLVQGISDGKIITIGKEEYRIWNPYHSKLAAMILKGSSISIKKDFKVLYLGAANGNTVSHVSDIVPLGTAFAVEFSPRAMHDLIGTATPRFNLVPILADVRRPHSYKNMVSRVDFIYQDVAQREQARIAIDNARLFLKEKGILVLIIKSKSIDSTRKSSLIFEKEVGILKKAFEIKELINLEPYHSDHMAVVAQLI